MKQTEWLVVAILLFAACIRFSGVTFGMPDASQFPSYASRDAIHDNTVLQPDEYQFVSPAFKMAIEGSFNPRYYINPPLPTYVTLLHILATGRANAVSAIERSDLDEREYAPFWIYVVSRTHSALGGLLAVAATYATARLIAGRYAGLVAGSLVAVTPLLVQYGGYAKNSSITAGLVAVCIWACLLALRQERYRWGLLAVAAIAIGAASASRYNSSPASIVLCAVGIILFIRQPTLETAKKVFVVWIIFPLTFIVSIPAILFSTREFLSGFTYGYQHYITGVHVTNPGQNGRFLIMQYLARHTIGIPAFIMSIVGLCGALTQQVRKQTIRLQNSQRLDVIILLLYMIPYVVVVMNPTNVFRSQELIVPIVPQFCLLAGLGATWLRNRISDKNNWVSGLIWIMSIIVPLTMTLQVVRTFIQADTREVTQDWIHENIPYDSNIHMVGPYNIALDPAFYNVTRTLGEQIDFDTLIEQDVEYAVVSDAFFRNIQLSGIYGDPEVVATNNQFMRYYQTYPHQIYAVEQPTIIGQNDPLHLLGYYHNPNLIIICLTEQSCAQFDV